MNGTITVKLGSGFIKAWNKSASVPVKAGHRFRTSPVQQGMFGTCLLNVWYNIRN